MKVKTKNYFVVTNNRFQEREGLTEIRATKTVPTKQKSPTFTVNVENMLEFHGQQAHAGTQTHEQ